MGSWENYFAPTLGEPIETATGTGTAYFASEAGTIEDLTSVNESDLPSKGKPDVVFPHGFFSLNMTGLTPGQTVTVTITLPDNVPVGTQYWKYHASDGGWIQIPMGSDDGDNVITITLIDGGLGDDDGIADGVIVDQGGPGKTEIPPVPVPAFNIFGLLALIGIMSAVHGILFALIMVGSVVSVMASRSGAQEGAMREANGDIISGNTLFLGEHGLHFHANYSDAASLKKIEDDTVVETITIADPNNFYIYEGVGTGSYQIWNKINCP